MENKGYHSTTLKQMKWNKVREKHVYPSKGFLPVNSSRSNTPKAKMSLFVLPIPGWPWSGELYPVSLISISEACFLQSIN